MDKNKTQRYWRICRTLALIISLISFTPLVIPHETYKPMLWGIPYTLWTGYVVTILLVALTYIGTKVHPAIYDEEEQP